MTKTFAQKNGSCDMGEDNTLTPNECKSVTLLFESGWSMESIAMSFMLDKTNISKHVRNKCMCLNEQETIQSHQLKMEIEIYNRYCNEDISLLELADEYPLGKARIGEIVNILKEVNNE